MKLIALEEHFLTRAVREAWAQIPAGDECNLILSLDRPEITMRLEDFADLRIKQMDASGVDVQVLSLTSPGVQNLDSPLAVDLARQSNDFIAGVVRQNPDRFEAFATLSTPDPEVAAKELRRVVCELGLQGAMLHGRTKTRNLDHPDFLPIFETAANLKVPLYIHPQPPQPAIRDIYYSGFSEKIDGALASFGWGWHHETGVQAVRLILAGVFDRYPDLQIILGHWGECLLFYLDRINGLSKVADHLQKPVADYVRENFYVTPGGILSPHYLKWALEVIGRERIMFATDYPYQIAPERGVAACSPSEQDSDGKSANEKILRGGIRHMWEKDAEPGRGGALTVLFQSFVIGAAHLVDEFFRFLDVFGSRHEKADLSGVRRLYDLRRLSSVHLQTKVHTHNTGGVVCTIVADSENLSKKDERESIAKP